LKGAGRNLLKSTPCQVGQKKKHEGRAAPFKVEYPRGEDKGKGKDAHLVIHIKTQLRSYEINSEEKEKKETCPVFSLEINTLK